MAHDPTRPPDNPRDNAPAHNAANVEPPKVMAIIQSGERRLAFIDGRYVREGDTLEAGKVEAIKRNSVVIRQGSSVFRVPVTESIKR